MELSQELDYRYAEAVLRSDRFVNRRAEIVRILQSADVPLLDPERVKRRKRNPLSGDHRVRYLLFPVDQKALNKRLDDAFTAAGWEPQPYIVDPGRTDLPSTGLKADFKRDKIQIEAQFGNMARWYTDVFKFQLSYSIDEIDVAVLIVPMQRFANLIDENVAHMERIARELPTAKMSLTLPIWVIGVEPEDYTPIEKRYDEGFEVLQDRKEKEIAKIPMRVRMEEEEEEDASE